MSTITYLLENRRGEFWVKENVWGTSRHAHRFTTRTLAFTVRDYFPPLFARVVLTSDYTYT
jgi:hypothetical protein